MRIECKRCAPALIALTFAALASPLLAQPVPSRMPGSTHIFPAGGRRGTTVEVRVGAECIPPGTNFYLSGSGISAPDVLGAKLSLLGEPSPRRLPTETPICYPKEWESRIEIAKDAPLGVAYWRLSCAQGGTGSRPFIVGDLPEYIERESNSVPERAERATWPVTINGQICGERDVDYFRLSGTSGIVVCEVLAARLGSSLDPIVEIASVAGAHVETKTRHAGSDRILAFCAEPSQEYLLRVASISEQGSPAHVYRINATVVESWEAAFRRETATGVPVEREPNSSRQEANPLSLPATVRGEFSRNGDDDWFRFHAEANMTLAITCRPTTGEGLAYPTLQVANAFGKELASASSVSAAGRVCRIEWKPAASGEFLVRARDLFSTAPDATRGGYELSIAPAKPDFALSLASDVVNVLQGGKAQFDVAVLRRGGFTGPIDLRLDGITTEGAALDSVRIPENTSTFKATISAKEDAAAASSALKLVGSAKLGEQTVERTAEARHLGADALGIAIGPSTLDHFHLTVQHKPLFRMFCAEAYQYAHRGSEYGYLMEFERLGGFDGPITLQLGDRQNRDLDGIEFREVILPPGETQIMLPIYLPETMHINVQSQSQLYAQAHATFVDKRGRQQSVLVVSEKRNLLRTLPPVLKLKAAERELSAKPGGSCTCRFELERTSNYSGPLEVELLAGPAGDKVACEKLVIPAGERSGQLTLHLAADAPRGKPLEMRFRAVGKLTESSRVISEEVVRLMVD